MNLEGALGASSVGRDLGALAYSHRGYAHTA